MSAYANSLSPEEALEAFLKRQTTPTSKVSAPEKDSFRIALRAENDALYVYNHRTGYIVLDSEEAGLIGYGDAPLDTTDMPPALTAVLKAYSCSPLSNKVSLAAHDNIPVMMTTKWDQDSPYNDDCPLLNGDRSVTGCMATALAQVLYHPSNRMQGNGTYDYLWGYGNGRISFNYDKNPFDYEAMLDTYSKNSSAESKAAVANLMYGIGVACQMNYHPQMSGTGDFVSGAALIRNLGCDKTLRVENRDFYTDTEWDEMVYNQLATGHPMVYTGSSKDMGHAFVCDGYERQDDRNYYHINWGWSGNGDGYFELSRLNPSSLGIGGGTSMSGFNFLQTGFFNIKPDEGTGETQIDFWQYGTLKPDVMEVSRRGRVNMSFEGNEFYEGGGVLSGCLKDVNAFIGFKYINIADNTAEYAKLSQSLFFNVGSGFNEFVMPCQLFPDDDGTYICKLAFLIGDTWYDAREELAYQGDLTVTLDGNNVTFGFTDNGLRLHADFIDFPGYVVKDEATKLTIEFYAGKEDVDTDVIPTIMTAAGKVLWQQSAQHLNLPFGETTTLEWDEHFAPNPRRGSYMLTLQNQEGENLITPFKINVVNEAAVEGIEAEGITGKTEYFTLDGKPINGTPEVGTIVIRKKGSRSEKVVMTD